MWQKSKKWPEMTKKICASTPYLSKHTSYDCVVLLHKFKMMTSPDAIFISLKCWFWRLLEEEGVKGAKNGLKWQKILSHFVSQELYLIWLWFLLHMCKMMISPAIFFHFFKSLIFRVFQNSSINAKRKFWGVPHLPHMCVIFLLNYDLICPNWSYQGQNYQNVPQIS